MIRRALLGGRGCPIKSTSVHLCPPVFSLRSMLGLHSHQPTFNFAVVPPLQVARQDKRRRELPEFHPTPNCLGTHGKPRSNLFECQEPHDVSSSSRVVDSSSSTRCHKSE